MTICHKNKLHNLNIRIRQLLQIMKIDDLAITCFSRFVVTEYTPDIHYQYNLTLVLFCTPTSLEILTLDLHDQDFLRLNSKM